MNKLIESIKVFLKWGFYTVLACLVVSYLFSFNEGFFVLMAGSLFTLFGALMTAFGENKNIKNVEDNSESMFDDPLLDPTSIEYQNYHDE